MIKNYVRKIDLFKGYRYKKRTVFINPKTGKVSVPQPYIKKSEESNHEFALSYLQWSSIVDDYFKIICDLLIEGEDVKFPKKLGMIRMTRKKQKPFIGIPYKKRYRNFNTMGYRPRVVWHKHKEGTFNFKHWYIFNLSRKKLWPIVGKALREKGEIIFKYPEYS